MKAITLIILALCADLQLSFAYDTQNVTRSRRHAAVCGVRGGGSSPLNRIVGGNVALPHEFPWQASLQKDNGIIGCGAIVMRRDWVLTSGHCLFDVQANQIIVVAGDHQLSDRDGSEQRIRAKQFFIHPHFVHAKLFNDIGLIKLAQPLRFDGRTVMPPCMPNPSYLRDGYPHTDCIVTGWGFTRGEGIPRISNMLRKVVLPLISDQKCANIYSRVKKVVTKEMLCAGYDEGGKDACKIDSGGPLVCQKQGNVYFLAGVVSWGIGCGRPNIPGVYTEVAYYLDWMNSVMGR